MRWSGRLVAAFVAALAAGVGASAACVLDLPSVCGDGSLDPGTEECDPSVDGDENCDPVTCKRIAVSTCGDGKLDLGEDCDTADFGVRECLSSKGFLTCTVDCKIDESTCDPCGNRRVDVGEECDQSAGGIGGFAQPKACVDLENYPRKPYSSGSTQTCDPNTCLWVRVSCGYCGDNEADEEELLDIHYPMSLSRFEVCDGDDFQPTELTAFCDDNCPAIGLRCTPGCRDDCKDFTPPEDDLQCCLRSDMPCPFPGDPAPCCAGFEPGIADPFNSALACENKAFGDGKQKSVCR